MSIVTDLQAAVTAILDEELPGATTKLYHGIADPTGTLVASGSFEMASVKLASAGDLDGDALRGWIRAAKEIDQKGAG